MVWGVVVGVAVGVRVKVAVGVAVWVDSTQGGSTHRATRLPSNSHTGTPPPPIPPTLLPHVKNPNPHLEFGLGRPHRHGPGFLRRLLLQPTLGGPRPLPRLRPSAPVGASIPGGGGFAFYGGRAADLAPQGGQGRGRGGVCLGRADGRGWLRGVGVEWGGKWHQEMKGLGWLRGWGGVAKGWQWKVKGCGSVAVEIERGWDGCRGAGGVGWPWRLQALQAWLVGTSLRPHAPIHCHLIYLSHPPPSHSFSLAPPRSPPRSCAPLPPPPPPRGRGTAPQLRWATRDI